MRLKEIREMRGLKQRDIAELLSCSIPVYSRYETGERKIPLDFLETLANFYGVTVDDLIGRGTDTVPPQEESALQTKLSRLTDRQRDKLEAIVDEMLGND